MSRDFLIPVRKAILTALKAEESVSDLVPAARIFPAKQPPNATWPFIRYGVGVDIPWKSSGEDGQAISTSVHCFARATDTLPDGEQSAGDIKAAIATVLDGPGGRGLVLPLTDDASAIVRVTGGRITADGEEADDWHAWVDIEVIVSAAA